jgi:chromosome segregation ATPase
MDKMVLGSIVGSVVLAFVLIVVIFSVKIKSQQDRIVSLKGRLSDSEGELESLKKSISQYENREIDSSRQIEIFQNTEGKLHQIISDIEHQRDEARSTIGDLDKKIAKLKKEKKVIIDSAEKIQHKLDSALEEIDDVHKRNEFWIDQISELRTKYDAIRQKLNISEGKQT